MNTLSNTAWWRVPQHFDNPLVFYIQEEQEEFIFGRGDLYLRCIEENSNTLIQLESWFTSSGQTRVTVVGPPRAAQWLRHMMTSVWSQESFCWDQGLEILQHVRSRPLTHTNITLRVPWDTCDLSLAAIMCGTITVAASLCPLLVCLGFP